MECRGASWLLCVILFASLCCLARAQATDYSQAQTDDEIGLKAFVGNLTNFQKIYAKNNFTGWGYDQKRACPRGQRTAEDAIGCAAAAGPSAAHAWTGITCNAVGQVTCLQLAGYILNGPSASLSKTLVNHTLFLTYIDLRGNQILGPLQEDWRQASSLQSMAISGNGLSGALPAEWGDAGSFLSLQQLLLDRNFLNGTLPDWGRGGMPQLKTLNLTANNFSGPVPASWSNLTALQKAYLLPGNKGLCGSLPPAVPVQEIAWTMTPAGPKEVLRTQATGLELLQPVCPSPASAAGR